MSFRSRMFVFALAVPLAGCASFFDENRGNSRGTKDGPSTAQIVAAEKVCEETRVQLATIEDGDQIQLRTCEAQFDGASEIAMVFVVNDDLEWTSLIASHHLDDVLYTIPLGLIAYGFGRSGVDPAMFDRILFMFDDAEQTAYDMVPSELDEVLSASTSQELKDAIRALRDTMRITALKDPPPEG